ncbi:MAG: AAA domain-containing protein [Candidatus Nitrohelix vancouverensis]|uniref:AAA domain-containing protein n=1 Tax=Candidatus Nitrohelix vancouverensis TaxID=2705534 RepID=A0A7T0C323_9BACT|nr:MAG: AAA domain-containing protein [Candidatus Nitrohelix vancouverensis]
MPQSIEEISQIVKQTGEFVPRVMNELNRVIVGQDYLLERLLLSLLTEEHVLLEGVPGLAKTTSVKALANTVHATFSRIQFTPDLLPADILGTQIYQPQKGEFTIKKGPLFANIILADEINRSPAKVQSALLEAMQERQITIGGETFPLESPFMVIATQNPIEQEGTYPLPEAQIDRFMFKLKVGYPSREEEIKIMQLMSARKESPSLNAVIGPEDLLKARTVFEKIYIDPNLEDYIVSLVTATRDPSQCNLPDLQPLIQFGASPRASIFLHRAAKAHAFLQGRGYVVPHDVKSIGMDVLRHRIILSYEADAENVDADEILKKIFDTVEVP